MADSKVEILLELNSRLEGINRAISGLDRTKKKAGLLNKELFSLSGATKNLGRNLISSSANMAKFGTAIAAGGSVVALVHATKKYGEFEAQMKAVEAVLQPSNKELKNLSDRAKLLGRTTRRTANESAAAMEVLAKAGLKTQEILDGALESSLALADSTGGDLAESAELVATALKNFNLEASETAELVDDINGVLINSKRDFASYYEALAKGAPAANLAGQSYKDFNAVISATASFFNDGGEQGTAYARFIQRLTNDTTAAVEVQEKYGLSFFNAEGQVRSFANIAGQLSDVLKSSTEEEVIRDFGKAFEARAARFAVALGKAGEAGVVYASKLNELANAQAQAEKRLEGFQGSVTKLKSAYEGLQLTFGKPIADNLTPYIQAITAQIAEIAANEKEAEEITNALFDAIVEGSAVAVDVIKNVRLAYLGLKTGVLTLLEVVATLSVASQDMGVAFLETLKQMIVGAGAMGDQLVEKILKPLNAMRELVGKEPISFDLKGNAADGMDELIGKVKFFRDVAKGSLEEIRKSQDAAAAEFTRVSGGISGDDVRAGAANIKKRAGEIKMASAELSDVNAHFIKLSQEATKAAYDTTKTQADRDALLKAAEDQSLVVDAKQRALDVLKGLVKEETALDRIRARNKLKAEIENFDQLSDIQKEAKLDELKAIKEADAEKAKLEAAAADKRIKAEKLKQETLAKQKAISERNARNAAIANKKKFDALKEGMLPAEDKIRQEYEAKRAIILAEESATDAEKKALLARLNTDEAADLAGLVGSDSSPSGSSSGGVDPSSSSGLSSGFSSLQQEFLPPEDAIIEEYARKREVILAEDGVTEAARTELLTKLTQQREDALAEIERSKTEAKLQMAGDFFGNMSSLMQSGNKKLFMIGKVAAIADATVQGILGVQKALASAPPPLNFALAASVGVATAVNVAKIASQQPPGFFTGGFIGGEGATPASSDNTPIMAATGEFVVNNRDAGRNAALLKAINAGKDPAAMIGASLPDLRAGGLGGGVDVSVVSAAPVVNSGGANVNVLNSIDPEDMFDMMEQNGMLDGWLENKMSDPGFSTRV